MKLALIVLLALGCAAHNWLESPPSRVGNTDQTVGPCPAPLPGYAATVLKEGESMSLVWTDNHVGGAPHIIRVLHESELAEYMSAPAAANVPVGTAASVTMPNLQVGRNAKHVVQYQWSNYYNCVDVVVAPRGSEASAGSLYVFALEDESGEYNAETGELTCKDGCEPAADGAVACECSITGGLHGFAIFIMAIMSLGVVVSIVALIVKSQMAKKAAISAPQKAAAATPSQRPAPGAAAAPARAAAPAAAAATPRPAAKFAVGEKVNALYREENQWYPAVVISNKSGIVVQFDGWADHVTLRENEVAKM